MSEENVEIIRDGLTGLNAWNISGAGNIDELLCKLLHQDVKWHDQSELPGASVHHGVQEVEDHLIAAREALDYEAAELVEILDVDEAVLAHYRVRARGRASGAHVEREAFYVYWFRGTKVGEVEIFGSRRMSSSSPPRWRQSCCAIEVDSGMSRLPCLDFGSLTTP